jgi:hypothetical protein
VLLLLLLLLLLVVVVVVVVLVVLVLRMQRLISFALLSTPGAAPRPTNCSSIFSCTISSAIRSTCPTARAVTRSIHSTHTTLIHRARHMQSLDQLLQDRAVAITCRVTN